MGGSIQNKFKWKKIRGRGEQSSYIRPVGALAGNMLAPQWLGNKEYWTKTESVYLFLSQCTESVHLYVYLYVSEINSLRNITYPTAPVTYTPVKMQKQRNVFPLFFFLTSTRHTRLTLIGFDRAQSQSGCDLFLPELWKQLANLRQHRHGWRFSTFSFCLVEKKKKKKAKTWRHGIISNGSEGLFKLSPM